MKTPILLVILILMFACSPQRRAQKHVRKANKHIQRAKELDPTISLTDTVIIERDVITEHVKHDTTVVKQPGDTIRIEKDKLRIKYVDKIDSVYIEGECLPDTITVTDTVVKEKIIQKEVSWWGRNSWWIILTIVVAVVFGFSKKII